MRTVVLVYSKQRALWRMQDSRFSTEGVVYITRPLLRIPHISSTHLHPVRTASRLQGNVNKVKYLYMRITEHCVSPCLILNILNILNIVQNSSLKKSTGTYERMRILIHLLVNLYTGTSILYLSLVLVLEDFEE